VHIVTNPNVYHAANITAAMPPSKLLILILILILLPLLLLIPLLCPVRLTRHAMKERGTLLIRPFFVFSVFVLALGGLPLYTSLEVSEQRPMTPLSLADEFVIVDTFGNLAMRQAKAFLAVLFGLLGLIQIAVFWDGLAAWVRICTLPYSQIRGTPYEEIWTSIRGATGILSLVVALVWFLTGRYTKGDHGNDGRPKRPSEPGPAAPLRDKPNAISG